MEHLWNDSGGVKSENTGDKNQFQFRSVHWTSFCPSTWGFPLSVAFHVHINRPLKFVSLIISLLCLLAPMQVEVFNGK